MGSSSGQVTGHKYRTSLILFIGNAIEKVLGINFDNRGWISPLIDENGDALAVGTVNSPNIYGETEGGVEGQIHARYGSSTQQPVEFYSEYLAENDIPPLAYQLQSYLAFDDFYVGNSGYIKEMLLWPKRTRLKNNGEPQWYEYDSSGTAVCEIAKSAIVYAQNEMNVNFYYHFLNNTERHKYNSEMGIHGTSSVSGYGGQANPDYSESVALISIPDDSMNHDLFDIRIRISGSFAHYSYSIMSASEVLSHKVFKVADTETYKSYDIHFICKSTSGIPYVVVELKGTVGLNESAHTFNGMLTSTTKLVDSAYYQFGDALDLNPIHKIREILTDNTAMNKPETDINNINFQKAADRIWSDGLGISWAIQEKSCVEAINELCYHIEGGIRINRQTGLYEVILFRDDWFDESEIYKLAENKIKNIDLGIQNGYEVINQLNVNYYDRDSIKNSSFSVAENASIRNLGGKVNAETVDFPYFMHQRNAEIVAKWKLKQFASAKWKGTFTTAEKRARGWNRYDIVKINWSKQGIVDLPVRILSIKLGVATSNLITVEFEEVVSVLGDLNTSVVIDDGIDNTVQLPKPCNAKVFELPYLEAVQANGERETNAELAENPEAGFICAIAEKPQSNSLNAALHIDSGDGFEKSATINYCETAYLEDSINKIASSFVVKNVGDLASLRIGSQIFINDETMVYQSYDKETKVLNVKRGAIDTVPQNHSDDSILYFADDFIAIDQTLYADGEQVEVKVLTTTPSGILSLNDAETHIVELNSRAIRPYAAANVKINGEYWPDEVESDLVITWVDRNKLQQTGGNLLGWFDGGVTLQDGVTYRLQVFEIDALSVETAMVDLNLGTVNSYQVDLSLSKQTTIKYRIKLYAELSSFESLFCFEHIVKTAFSAPFNVSVSIS